MRYFLSSLVTSCCLIITLSGCGTESAPVRPDGVCTPPLVQCGNVCVDLTSDPNNCNGCGNSCGVNAICSLSSCQCIGGYQDCNQTSYDGCECTACSQTNPTQCATASACDPSQQDSCAANDKYCDNATGTAICIACPTGFLNCDGQWGCECQGTCNGTSCSSGQTTCDPASATGCNGSIDAYCDSTTKQCLSCPTNYKNCDGQWNCECQGTCNGTTCETGTTEQCNPTNPFDCAANDTTQYCDPSTLTCKACVNTSNCDGIGGCETAGTSCDTTKTCSPTASNNCGSINWFCDSTSNTCQPCPTGTINCDGTYGCEVAGTTCTAPPQQCNQTYPFNCGSRDKYCATDNKCYDCSTGTLNCDGINACETTGTTCTTTPTTCTVNGVQGVCQDSNTQSCSGSYVAGYCPGASNIQCCVATTTPTSCTDGVNTGVCQDTNTQTCDGTYKAGYCPGATNIQCCLPNTTTTCDPYSTYNCGSDSKYCSTSTKTCVACPSGKYNCDQKGSNGCESSSPCGSTTTCTDDYGNSGTCLDSSNTNLCTNGLYVSNKCPNLPSNIKCCIPIDGNYDVIAKSAKLNDTGYAWDSSGSTTIQKADPLVCIQWNCSGSEYCSDHATNTYIPSWNDSLGIFAASTLTGTHCLTFEDHDDVTFNDTMGECNFTVVATDIQSGTKIVTGSCTGGDSGQDILDTFTISFTKK